MNEDMKQLNQDPEYLKSMPDDWLIESITRNAMLTERYRRYLEAQKQEADRRGIDLEGVV